MIDFKPPILLIYFMATRCLYARHASSAKQYARNAWRAFDIADTLFLHFSRLPERPLILSMAAGVRHYDDAFSLYACRLISGQRIMRQPTYLAILRRSCSSS